jgi:hypothetical protein
MVPAQLQAVVNLMNEENFASFFLKKKFPRNFLVVMSLLVGVRVVVVGREMGVAVVGREMGLVALVPTT